jgi:hypothetical protein
MPRLSEDQVRHPGILILGLDFRSFDVSLRRWNSPSGVLNHPSGRENIALSSFN